MFDFYFIKTVSFSDAVGVPDVLYSHYYYIDEIEMLFITSAISDWFFSFFLPLIDEQQMALESIMYLHKLP